VSGAATVRAIGETLLKRCRASHHSRVFALYIERMGELAAQACIVPETLKRPNDGYLLEHRFVSWLASVENKQLRGVPTFLMPWLPLKRALVLPLRADGRNLGAFVTESDGLKRQDVVDFESLVDEAVSLLLEHQQTHARTDSVPNLLVNSIRRLRTIPDLESG